MSSKTLVCVSEISVAPISLHVTWRGFQSQLPTISAKPKGCNLKRTAFCEERAQYIC